MNYTTYETLSKSVLNSEFKSLFSIIHSNNKILTTIADIHEYWVSLKELRTVSYSNIYQTYTTQLHASRLTLKLA